MTGGERIGWQGKKSKDKMVNKSFYMYTDFQQNSIDFSDENYYK